MSGALPKRTQRAKATSNIAGRRRLALKDGDADYLARRSRLIEVAVNLFQSQGYKMTTLADIGRQAGIDRATLYYYFSSKEELFRESIQDVLAKNLDVADQLLQDPQASARAKVERLVEALMTSYEQSYPHMYIYIGELMHQVADNPTPWAKGMLERTRKFASTMQTIIEEGVASGEFRADIAPSLMSKSIFGMVNWTHRWFRPGGAMDAAQLAAAFCSIFLDGLATRPADKALPGATTPKARKHAAAP